MAQQRFPRLRFVPTYSIAIVLMLLGFGAVIAGCTVPPAESTTPGGPASLAITAPAPEAWRSADAINSECDGDARVLQGITVQRSAAGFARATFEIGGAPPCYRIGLVDETLQDGSGNQIELHAPQGLRVELLGFDPSVPSSGGALEPGYSIAGDGTYIFNVLFSSLFEQSATSFIGVNEGSEFAVQTLTNPTRVIVDVKRAD